MTLKFANESPDAMALVRSHLQRLLRRPNAPVAFGADAAALDLQSPHPVYDLRADEIAAGAGLESARATGLRYLVVSAGAAVAAAEIQIDDSGAARQFANVNQGPFVQATAQSFHRLATLDAVQAGSYQVRLLRFSAIYLIAVWLKPESAASDMIVPVAPAPPGLEPGRPYEGKEFLEIIRPMAVARVTKADQSAIP